MTTAPAFAWNRRLLWTGAAAALAALAGAVLAARLGGIGLGLPLDDAWIHAAFARNLARDHVWGLLAGTPGGGESSLLWPLLLLPGELGGHAGAPLLALAWGAAAYLALPGLAGHLAGGPRRGLAVALAAGLGGPQLFAALSGMETVPALTCGVAALVLVRAGRPTASGLLAAAAILLRPDAAFLLPVLALMTPPGERRRLWPAAAAVVLAAVLLSLLEGRFPPATLAGRRWIVGLPRHVDVLQAPRGLLTLVRTWGAGLVADLGAARLLPAGLPAFAWGAAWSLAAAAAVGPWVTAAFRSARRNQLAPAHGLAAWALLAVLFYAVVLPDWGHAGRYQPQVWLAATVAAVEGLALLAVRGRRARAAALAAAGVLGLGLVASTVDAARVWAGAVRHIERLHVAAARDLPGLVGPDARVAVFDVGAAAYLRPCPLVDLSGLSDREALGALYSRHVDTLLLERGATHLLLPDWDGTDGPGSLRDRLGLTRSKRIVLVPVRAWRYPTDRWWRQFRFTGNAFPRLDLDRVEPEASGTPDS